MLSRSQVQEMIQQFGQTASEMGDVQRDGTLHIPMLAVLEAAQDMTISQLGRALRYFQNPTGSDLCAAELIQRVCTKNARQMVFRSLHNPEEARKLRRLING